MWNREEQHRLFDFWGKSKGDADALLGLASLAVDLVAARSGTMTAERIADLRESMASLKQKHPAIAEEIGEALRHITAQGATVAMLQAKVVELEGQLVAAREPYRCACETRESLSAEVERLKAEIVTQHNYRKHFRDRAISAESRLAAIREMDVERACEVLHDAYEAAAKKAGWETQARSRKPWADVPEANKATMRAAVAGLKRWMLEGDAAQEAKACPLCHGKGTAMDVDRWPSPTRATPSVCRICDGTGKVPEDEQEVTPARYPCSPTCTHDDAATPGHPERVKERSEAFIAATLSDGTADTRSTAGIDNVLQVQPKAVGRVLTPRDADAYEEGVEAMRAACWEAVVERLVRHGLQRFRNDFKAAIEGAAP